jgi:hypothetical protein
VFLLVGQVLEVVQVGAHLQGDLDLAMLLLYLWQYLFPEVVNLVKLVDGLYNQISLAAVKVVAFLSLRFLRLGGQTTQL